MKFIIPEPRKVDWGDWKESWVDQMGLILAMSGEERFKRMEAFKLEMLVLLTSEQREELKECLRQRFTPSSYESRTDPSGT